MQVTLRFDTDDVYHERVRPHVNAYLRGELTARELCQRAGWGGEDFANHLGGIFCLAMLGGPASVTVPTREQEQRDAADRLNQALGLD
jgi:hypothetical protein